MILLAGCGGRSGLTYHDGAAPDGPLPCNHPKVTPSCLKGYCTIKAGCFTMGSPIGENCRQTTETAHTVTLTHDFFLGQTEVTQSQFTKVMGYNPSYFKNGNRPVERVSWHEAAAYCNAMSKLLGDKPCYDCSGSQSAVRCEVAAAYKASSILACLGLRLPTEAEWEYAYRAGSSTAYYLGPSTTCTNVDPVLNKIGYYARNSGKSTQPVGKLLPNAWGLLDMSGNVWEWTNDWWTQDLGQARVTDPPGPATGMLRTVKGGSWGSAAGDTRAASRDGVLPHRQFDSEGFRVAQTIH